MNNFERRRPRESGDPGLKLFLKDRFVAWIPAFAGMTALLTHNLWAMASRPNTDPSAPPPPGWTQWFPIVVMVGVFYFLLIRPQMQQKKQRERMMHDLKKGDRIVTQGGLIGTVVNVTPGELEIKLNEETKVKLRRSGVAEVLANESQTEVVAGK